MTRTAEAGAEYARRLLDGHRMAADRVNDLLRGLSDDAIRAREAELSIRDHGPGIPAGEQQRIFQRFGRLAAVHHHGGFGLGLWTAQEIARAHGGRVEVESIPGEGATFRLFLPRVVSRIVD